MEIIVNIHEARQIVHEACVELVRAGLVARTWGNISARVDDEVFVITPSGRKYEDLQASDMVAVNIEELSYKGLVKPSSEKGLHAEIYRNDPSIKTIIHTHQMNASTVAAARRDITGMNPKHTAILGPAVRVAAYALPGTVKLARATARALRGNRAALMANHGAVCVGRNMKESFAVARALEEAAEEYIKKCFAAESGITSAISLQVMHDYYLKIMTRR